MKHFIFAKTISYWQWLTMSAGLAVAFWLGNGWGLLTWLGIMLVGAAIEALFGCEEGGGQLPHKTVEDIDPEGLKGGDQ